MSRPTTVETLPSSAWRRGRDEERRIEVEHRCEDKGNQSQNPRAGYHRGRGGETNGENQHEKERWHNSPSLEGGRCLAGNAYQKRKQNNVHHKGKKTKHAVLCHCVSSQITLAAPPARSGGGRRQDDTKNEHEKPTVLCLCLAARLPRPWPRTECGGRREGRKANRPAKTDHPGPSTEQGVGRTRKI